MMVGLEGQICNKIVGTTRNGAINVRKRKFRKRVEEGRVF